MVTFEASKLDFFSKDTPNKLIPGLSFDFFFACMLACLMCNTFLFFGRKGETKKKKNPKHVWKQDYSVLTLTLK